MKHAISARLLAHPNHLAVICLINFGTHMIILFIVKAKILCTLSHHTCPPIMLIIEPRLASIC